MLSYQEIKDKMEKEHKYYAEDTLIFNALRSLKKFEDGKVHPGQDIYAICLEGPPGSGKSEYAKVYTKIANEVFDNEVVLIKYQCDPTTGKSELFEEVNISAAIRRDADNVNIPGKLVKAIEAVNAGKKVVLFLDEFEKSRLETDTFLLEFLQSGQLNANQLGDLKIKDEYKHNLQVILAKNDARELTQPLRRRIEPMRLDYMRPEIFYKVATDYFKDYLEYEDLTDGEKAIAKQGLDGIINLVCLMYNKAYEHEELYARIPSCSEMLIAIDSAYALSTCGAPKRILYDKIISNMFKDEDDIETFESVVEDDSKNSTNDRLTKLLKEMKEGLPFEFKDQNEAYDLNDIIAEKIYPDRYKEINSLKEQLVEKIAYYDREFKDLKSQLDRINLENGEIVEQNIDVQNALPNFYDETVNIKRGVKVESLMKDGAMSVGTFTCPTFPYSDFVEKISRFASDINITLYENGILIGNDCDTPLVVIASPSTNGNFINFTFLSGSMVAHPNFIVDIYAFISLVCSYIDTRKTSDKAVSYQLSSLVYNEGTFSQSFDQIGSKNVYHVELSENITWSTVNSNLTKTKLHDLATSDFQFTEEGFRKVLDSFNVQRKNMMANENR